jgi:hypothetical protein
MSSKRRNEDKEARKNESNSKTIYEILKWSIRVYYGLSRFQINATTSTKDFNYREGILLKLGTYKVLWYKFFQNSFSLTYLYYMITIETAKSNLTRLTLN